MITASVYKGFKCIRNLRYSFHSFRCCLHLRIIRISSADAEQYHAARPTILKGTIAKPPSKPLSSRYRPKRDVLVHYTPDDPKMKPYGFSGAAAWSERAERSGPVWSSEPTVFGVPTDAFMPSKLLLVVGAPTIKKFLEGSF